MAVINSTSVTVSWQVRPEIFSNGIIGGFKLFYRKNSSAVLPTILTIKNGTIHRQDITGLDRYTKYEFQVLAFTSVGDGPKSAVLVERTKEDGKILELVVAELNRKSFLFRKATLQAL